MASSPQNPKPNQVVQRTSLEAYSGPLPHPAILEKFEQILPGSAERILKMAESQSEHRQCIEKVVIRSGSRNSLLGIVSALLISLGFLAVAWFAIRNGHAGAGTFLGTINIVGLAGIFVYGTASNRRERLERNRQNTQGSG